jgi:hypothetical protein
MLPTEPVKISVEVIFYFYFSVRLLFKKPQLLPTEPVKMSVEVR